MILHYSMYYLIFARKVAGSDYLLVAVACVGF